MCKRIQPLLLYMSVIQLEQTVLVTNSDNDCNKISIEILSHSVKLKSGLYAAYMDNDRDNFDFKLNRSRIFNSWAQTES